MAERLVYATVEEAKTLLKIKADDLRDDAALEAALEAASRQMDNWTGRFFGETVEQARYYRANRWDDAGEIPIDDAISVSEVAVDAVEDYTWSELWPSSDYRLRPEGSLALERPYNLVKSIVTSRAFPDRADAVRVTGVWGWPVTPAPVARATIIQAARLWKRGTAPFGIIGSPDMGQTTTISTLDPDVRSLLSPYRVLAF